MGFNPRNFVLGAVALACLSGFSAVAAAEQASVPTLTVVGSSRVAVRPDMALVTTGVATASRTAEEALAANSAAMEQVIKTIKAAGIDAKDVGTSGFSIQPQYSYPVQGVRESPKVVGYEVRNGVTIKVRELASIGPLLDRIVQSGANQASGLTFLSSRSGDIEEQAGVEAVKDAVSKAGRLADAAGVKLVRIMKIEPRADAAVFATQAAPMMARAQAERAVPIEAGETEARASVSVVYEIEQR